MSATPQNDRVNDITLEDINAMVVDTANKSSEIMKTIVANPKPWNGRAFQSPITTGVSSLGTSFKGEETFDTTIDFPPVNMVWYPTGYAQPVGVSLVERSINQTPAGVIDLYKASYQYAQNSMITNLGQIFYGYGAGNDFDGLGLVDDNGTNTTSYAGLNRSTYPTINAFLVAASAGVLDLATMSSANDGATISGNESETPNKILGNQTVFSLYDSLLEPTSRATYSSMGGQFIDGTSGNNQPFSQANALTLTAGATSVTYRGIPLVRDQKAPSGNMYMINDKWFEFRSLPLVGLNVVGTTESVTSGAYDDYKVSAFQFRDLMQPVNQLAEVGIFVMYGNLICKNPNRNALITGISTT